MFKLIIRGVVAAMVLWASPAAAAESPAKMALATEVSRHFVDLINIEEAVTAGLTSAETGGMLALQPQWRGMLGDAFREQIARDHELIVVLMARGMAPHFSEEELKAGAAILSDPAVRAGVRNRNDSGPQPSKATTRLMGSPAGKGFLTKFANVGALLQPLQEQMVLALVPGVFRNFGEKAEALETARRAAEGLPSSKR